MMAPVIPSTLSVSGSPDVEHCSEKSRLGEARLRVLPTLEAEEPAYSNT